MKTMDQLYTLRVLEGAWEFAQPTSLKVLCGLRLHILDISKEHGLPDSLLWAVCSALQAVGFFFSEGWAPPGLPFLNSTLSLSVSSHNETTNLAVLSRAISFLLPLPVIVFLWICFVFHLPNESMNKITMFCFSDIFITWLLWCPAGWVTSHDHMIYTPKLSVTVKWLWAWIQS